MHSITTRRRKVFYWAAVLATFALGTALGDLTAVVLRLGFAWSAALFALVITAPLIGWARFGLSPVVDFWSAYVLTRPLGASVADWLGKPAHLAGGLGLGDGIVAAAGLVLMAGLVTWCARAGRDARARRRAPAVSGVEALALGVVRGLTEFVPVSSSAHLRIAGALFGWPDRRRSPPTPTSPRATPGGRRDRTLHPENSPGDQGTFPGVRSRPPDGISR